MARPLYKNLTVQVLTAVAIGVAIGALGRRFGAPELGEAFRPLADGFIKLVRMVVGPIIFLTVVLGISGMSDLRRAGRTGVKALLYFEAVTTVALAIGLAVANVVRPGRGVAPPTAEQVGAVVEFVRRGQTHSFKEFVLGIIPDNFLGALAGGDPLPILFLAVLTGVAVAGLGEKKERVVSGLERLTEVMFRIVGLVMRVAPLGALGAMAATIGKFGPEALGPLLKLMGCVYLTMGLFIFVVLGLVARACGIGLLRFLAYIKDEILLVLGTSSSESALPRMMQKLERCGCGRGVVELVIPTGYSFNLDGTSIYLSMAVLFIAQVYGVPMSLGQQLGVLGVLLLTSKGAAGVTGAGFITLAATLSATRVLPVEGLALLLGVDRFMSEARAITNLIGNGVATVAVSVMEGEFDRGRYGAAVNGG